MICARQSGSDRDCPVLSKVTHLMQYGGNACDMLTAVLLIMGRLPHQPGPYCMQKNISTMINCVVLPESNRASHFVCDGSTQLSTSCCWHGQQASLYIPLYSKAVSALLPHLMLRFDQLPFQPVPMQAR